MPKKGHYKLNSEDSVIIIKLYELGVPTSTIGHIYGLSTAGIWNVLKRHEKINLLKLRNRSETNVITLSKKHSEPKGDSEKRVNEWLKFGIEGIIDLITVILLTDGSSSYRQKTVSLYNSDKTALGIFTDLLKVINLNPRESLDRRNGLPVVFARGNNVKSLLNEIRKRTPTTKHQPDRNSQTWKEYLKETQPTLSFLNRKSEEIKQLAFRIAISLEGCAIINVFPKRISRPSLQFTCFHPTLIKEWRKIAREVKVPMYIKGNNLSTSSFSSFIEFIRIGGFLNGFVASNKSRYFSGIEKNKILLGMLEYFYRVKEKTIPNEFLSSNVNKIVRRLIENSEIKEPQFYIKYFTNLSEGYHGMKTEKGIIGSLKLKSCHIKEIIYKTGFKEQRVYPILQRLIQNGKVKRVKFGVYSIKK